MRSINLFSALTAILFVIPACGPSKPDPRDRPDFVDTSDPGSVSLYSEDDFKKKKGPSGR